MAVPPRALANTTWCVLGTAVLIAACGRTGPKPAGAFDQARELVTQARYQQAIPLLSDFRRRYPTSPDASRAGLFLGKAHLALGDFEEAKKEFQHTIQTYPQSLEAHKCRYKLALVAMLEGSPQRAVELFRKLTDKPAGPLVPEATAMVRYLETPPAGRQPGPAPEEI